MLRSLLFVSLLSIISISARADTLPENGIIAYSHMSPAEATIYTMDIMGEPTLVSRQNEMSAFPDLSPDGTQIVYTTIRQRRGREDTADLFIMNRDGSDIRSLTKDAHWNTRPMFSPDGTEIAFLSNRSGRHNIHILTLSTNEIRQLTDTLDGFFNPVWSPDGSQIAFHGPVRYDNEIFTVNIDGSNLQQITNDDVDNIRPHWSPDGTQIVYQSVHDERNTVRSFDLASNTSRRLTFDDFDNTHPRWSPDGTQIIYSSRRDPQTPAAIYTMQPNGSDIREIYLPESGDAIYAVWWMPTIVGDEIRRETNVPVKTLSSSTIPLPNCDNPSPIDQSITYDQSHSQQTIIQTSNTMLDGGGSARSEAQGNEWFASIRIPFVNVEGGGAASAVQTDTNFDITLQALEERYGTITQETLSSSQTLRPRAEPHTSMEYDIEWNIMATVGTFELKTGARVVDYVDYIITNEIQGRYVEIRQMDCP